MYAWAGQKLKHLSILLICLVIGLSLSTVTLQITYADAPPSQPNQFYGTVTINGTLAGAGDTVTAQVGGTNVTSGTTDSQGRYGYSPLFMVTASQGSTIAFYINGVRADETAAFATGAVARLNLTVSGSVTPPSGSCAISNTTLPGGTVGSAYSATLQANGGTTPYTWSISSGSLPAGLTLYASTGVIAGTPTTAQTYNFTVQVYDSAAHIASQSLSIQVSTTSTASLYITTTSLPVGTVSSAYSTTLQASGGTTPYTWSFSSGSMPAGLTLYASTGVISGTPTTAQTYNFTVQVYDSAAHTASQSLSIQVSTTSTASLYITTTSLPEGTVSSAYSTTLQASGGTTPYIWSISSGSMPAGLTLSTSTGVISGTPTTAQTYNFTAQVYDSAAHAASQSFSIQVNTITPAAQTITISTNVLGQSGSFNISSGVLSTATSLSSSDGTVQLNFNANTNVGLTGQSLTVTAEASPPPPLSNTTVINAYSFGPNNSTFNPAITVTFKYNPASLPAGIPESSLYIAYWSGANWIALATQVDTQNKILTTQLSHFTIFAVMAPTGQTTQAPTTPPASSPASFSVSNLSVSSTSVAPGDQVTITAQVTNNGSSQGDYKAVLNVNSADEAEKDVTVAPGKTEMVTFTVTKQQAGAYNIAIGDQSQSFVVSTSEKVANTGGISPLPIVIAVGAMLLILFVLSIFLKRPGR